MAVTRDILNAYVCAEPPQRYYHLGFSEAAWYYRRDVRVETAPGGCGRPARLVSLPGLAYFNDPTSPRVLERVSDAACRKASLDECGSAAVQFVYGTDAGAGFCYLQSEVRCCADR
ncbi:unnamed protein product [Miscanthus lutarioriparius]|uniref:Uncharacterized protein n=1 Tax=Miscanthus lutarioriparius TaxID=422564 RepID=A0A811R9Y2_9POAL|nr:unnamed protein product [Miscanthus lutarioriparius]